MTGCELFAEHYEMFALGALEGEERVGIQEHLDGGCPVCLDAMRQANLLVANIAWTAPRNVPRAALRRRLLRTIEAQRPRRAWLPVWTWAAVAAAVIIGVLLGSQIRSLRLETARLEAVNRELSERNAMYTRVLAVLSAPGTRSISLAATTAASPQMNAYWNEIAGLVLTGRHMPALPADRTYQLWVVPRTGNPVSAGIFEPDVEGSALLISQPQAKPADAAALAITQEPAGGRPQPTSKPVWVGPIG